MSSRSRASLALLVLFPVAAAAVSASALAQGQPEASIVLATEHLKLLTDHQAFLEKMYFSAAGLIAVVVTIFGGLVVFFGLRSKAQIDEIVRDHFSSRVKERVESLFEDLREEMVLSIQARTEGLFKESAEHVSDDLAGSNEVIAKLEREVAELRASIEQTRQGEAAGSSPSPETQTSAAPEGDLEDVAWERMKYALLKHKYVWRSIERLALEARISPLEAEEILGKHSTEVRISRGKSGRRIARHLTRQPNR